MLLGFGTHPVELLIVVAVALLLFGKRLPDVMRSLGKSVTEFKKGISDTTSDDAKGSSSDGANRPS